MDAEENIKQDLIREIENLSGYPLKLCSDERWRIITLKLLQTDGAVSANQVMEQFAYITHDTVQRYRPRGSLDGCARLVPQPQTGGKGCVKMAPTSTAAQRYRRLPVGKCRGDGLAGFVQRHQEDTTHAAQGPRVGLLQALQAFF